MPHKNALEELFYNLTKSQGMAVQNEWRTAEGITPSIRAPDWQFRPIKKQTSSATVPSLLPVIVAP